jgi:P-type Cu2+ transporter
MSDTVSLPASADALGARTGGVPAPRSEVAFSIGGMTCGGCAWGLERALAGTQGVDAAEVNFARRLAHVAYDPNQTDREALARVVSAAGFEAFPHRASDEERALEQEYRERLRGLGLAALLGMQLMMIAATLYAGEWSGMSEGFETFFRWLGVVLTVPLLAFPGRSFYASASRALAARTVNMDVPIALALSIAFAASVAATVRGEGAVYYDSLGMFVLLLLAARFLEFIARRRSLEQVWALGRAVPLTAHRRCADGSIETVAADALAAGDVVVVRAGEQVPADGVVVHGRSRVEESLLTGESAPVSRGPGERLLAGTVNREGPLEMRIDRIGRATARAALLEFAARASREKPRLARIADRVAGHFVAAILVVALAVAIGWALTAPERWLEVTIALLIVTCPCALSLATPCAIGAGVQALASRGVYVTRADMIERLASVSRFVFDKTGTLTEERLELEAIAAVPGASAAECLRIAGTLEAYANHPIAAALVREAASSASAEASPVTTDVVVTTGEGVSGRIDGRSYRIGSPAFAGVGERGGPGGECGPVAVLAGPDGVLATFRFREVERAGAAELVRRLEEAGLRSAIYSGDATAAVESVAGRLGVVDWCGALAPDEKLARVRAHQAAGERIAMVGDGLNDTPALAGADVSIALGCAAAVPDQHADAVLVKEDLELLSWAVTKSREVYRIVKQNLGWALAYNALAIPAAAAGWVSPWMAALGMSLSSMLVVANALRAARP